MMGLVRPFEFSQSFDRVIEEEKMFGIISKLAKCGSGSLTFEGGNPYLPPIRHLHQGCR
jgi:hypothetical protein